MIELLRFSSVNFNVLVTRLYFSYNFYNVKINDIEFNLFLLFIIFKNNQNIQSIFLFIQDIRAPL